METPMKTTAGKRIKSATLRLFRRHVFGKHIGLAAAILLATDTIGRSQHANQTWNGTTSSWQGANNWQEGFSRYPIEFGTQLWTGLGNITSQTNNNGGNALSTNEWVFGINQNSPLTFSGDPVRFYDSGGFDPRIDSHSNATHNINMDISGDGDPEDPLRVELNNDSGGGLVFNGAVNNQGSNIHVGGHAANPATVRFNGVVSGSGGIHKENANILLLFDAANTQTGQLTVQSGTARLNGAGDTFGASSQDIRIHSGGVLDLNNVSTTVGSVAEEGFENSGIVALGSGTLTIAGANKGTFYQNTISGSGGLTMAGSGNTTMVLFGNQTYTGPTTVTSGSLGTLGSMSSTQYTVAGGNFSTDTYNNLLPSSANITLSSGTIKLGGSETVRTISSTGGTFDMNGKNLTANSSASTTFAGTLAGGNSTFAKQGSGTLTLTANNSYTGGTYIDGGTLALSGTGSLAQSQSVKVGAGAVLDIGGVSSSATVQTISEVGFQNGGEVHLGSKTLNVVGANKGTFYQNTISGSGGLAMAGSGNTTMVLYGNQTYTGTTTITGGTLQIGAGGEVGSVFHSPNIENNATLLFNHTGAQALAADMSGSGAIAKQGNGTTILSGNVSHTGATTISGGTLALSGNASLSQTPLIQIGSGAVFDISGVSSSATVQAVSEEGFADGGEVHLGSKTLNVVGANKGFFYQNTISGSGGLTMAGSGNTTMILYGNQTYTGATTITGGTLQIGLVLDESTVAFSSPSISNNSALNLAHNGIQNLSADMGGSGTLAKFGNGTTTISGNFAHTGTTTISGGTLALAGNGSLSQSGFIRIGSGAALDISGVSSPATVQAVSEEGFADGGGVHLGSNTLIVAGANKGTFFQNTISGSGGLTMAGSGNTTMVLYGNATYTGATTITGGTLSVTGSLNNSTATVQSGATLSGSGSVGGLILNSGARLSPGNSPGTLTVGGNATWNGGASLNWQVASANANPFAQTAAGTGWDFVDIGGTLTLGVDTSNKFHINLWSLSSTGPDVDGTVPGWDPTVGSTWLIARAAGGIYRDGVLLAANSNFNSFFNINTAATGGAGGWIGPLPASFNIVTLGDSGNLYLQALANGSAAVPEPGQIAASLLLLAAAGGWMLSKRRRSSAAKGGVRMAED
jgi:autotransporter-associated beta strand protein